MQIDGEIVLPDTKPETEWISDRPVQKSMPTYDHSIALKPLTLAGKVIGGDACAGSEPGRRCSRRSEA